MKSYYRWHRLPYIRSLFVGCTVYACSGKLIRSSREVSQGS